MNYVGSNFTSLVRNGGTIVGDIELGNFADTLDNAGMIQGLVNLGDGVDRMTNSGTISGDVVIGEGQNLALRVGYTQFDDNDTLVNTSTFSGNVWLGMGNDYVDTSPGLWRAGSTAAKATTPSSARSTPTTSGASMA